MDRGERCAENFQFLFIKLTLGKVGVAFQQLLSFQNELLLPSLYELVENM